MNENTGDDDVSDDASNAGATASASAAVGEANGPRAPASAPQAVPPHLPVAARVAQDLKTPLDRRRHAYRPDLAAENLQGRVDAKRYVAGNWGQVVVPSIQVRNKPDTAAAVDTEALFGEVLVVYDVAAGWAWVQLLRDSYVGYVPVSAISGDVEWPTHRVKAIGTFVYPEPDIKKPPLAHLSLNSALKVLDQHEQFYALSSGGFVTVRHVAAEDSFARDFVDVAERFMGTPYLWGGRTRLGIDCSGLVQISLEAAGVPAPRDSDMQRAEIGNDVLMREDYEGLQRGDLIFWPGHVGIMTDGVMLLHANAHHMAVTVEPLPEAIERMGRTGTRPTAVKRPGTLGV